VAKFKTVLRHSSYVFGSRVLSRVLYTIFFLFAASRLGPELFGLISLVMALVELLSSIGDMGLGRYGARALIRQWDKRAMLSGEILVLQVLTSIVFSVGGIIVVLALAPSAPKLQLMLLGMIAVFLSGFINAAESVFIAGQKFFYSAFLNFFNRLVFVVLGFVALSMGASVVTVMWCFLAGLALEAVCRLVLVARKITPFSFKFPLVQLRIILFASLPFALGAIANMIFLRVNILALGILEEDTAVGVFNVAYTLFIPFIWIPVTLSRTTLPGFTEMYHRDPDAARQNSWQWYRLMAILGIPLALTVTLLAGPMLSYIEGYEGSATVFAILIWSVPAMLVSSIDFNILQVVDQEKLTARLLVWVAITTVVLNFILIPIYGINGAAIATVGGTVLRQVLFYRGVRKHFMMKHTAVLFIQPFMSGLVMAAVALLLWQISPWLATGAGLMAYAAAILITGSVRISEIKTLLRS